MTCFVIGTLSCFLCMSLLCLGIVLFSIACIYHEIMAFSVFFLFLFFFNGDYLSLSGNVALDKKKAWTVKQTRAHTHTHTNTHSFTVIDRGRVCFLIVLRNAKDPKWQSYLHSLLVYASSNLTEA